MTDYDVCIIGAGASGLSAAIEAGRRGLRTVIIDKNKKCGTKLYATGNGRCNLTNINAAGSAYNAPDFVAPCFEKYGPAFVTDFFRGLGLVTYADSEALERDYGFTPRIGIREGLRKFAEWYKAYYG